MQRNYVRKSKKEKKSCYLIESKLVVQKQHATDSN